MTVPNPVPTGRRGRRGGFTLVEIMVVVGIIIVLLSLLIPGIAAIRRNSEKKAVQMDLQTLTIALDAYNSDFKDYPHPPLTNRNYHVMAWALLGCAEVLDPWGKTYSDGQPGAGFRTPSADRVWGPYVSSDKFQNSTSDYANPYKWDLYDRYGSPIEYFPRWRQLSLTDPSLKLFDDGNTGPFPMSDTGPSTPLPVKSVYDYHQCMQRTGSPVTEPPKPGGITGTETDNPVVDYFRKVLGDDNLNDKVDAGEKLKETPPFLLLSWGPNRLNPQFTTRKIIQSNPSKTRLMSNLPEY